MWRKERSFLAARLAVLRRTAAQFPLRAVAQEQTLPLPLN
jgi:hypothetical protein